MFVLGVYECLRASLISALNSSASYGSRLRHACSTVVIYSPWGGLPGSYGKIGSMGQQRNLGLGKGNPRWILHPVVCLWSCSHCCCCCWNVRNSVIMWVVILWVATSMVWADTPCLLAQSVKFVLLSYQDVSMSELSSLSWWIHCILCKSLCQSCLLVHSYMYSSIVYRYLWCCW